MLIYLVGVLDKDSIRDVVVRFGLIRLWLDLRHRVQVYRLIFRRRNRDMFDRWLRLVLCHFRKQMRGDNALMFILNFYGISRNRERIRKKNREIRRDKECNRNI